MSLSCVSEFEKTYLREPEDVAFCPYRVCPVGAHSDHQLGKVTGFAIDRGIHIAFAPKMNGVVELHSLQFLKRAQWHVRAVPETKCDDWADYLRGATMVLASRFNLSVGIVGVIEGTLPIGGLSSSAAVTIAFLKALCKVNSLHLEDIDVINIAKEAENKYVGVQCGKLDQSCEVYSRKDCLLYLDTRDDSYELIPRNASMKPFDIVVLFSGLERSLAGSKYNMRVDECRSAAYALKAYAGMDYGKFPETNLREVPVSVFHQYGQRLPQTWRRRAEHWYSEQERVERCAEAWRKGDIDGFGRISFESGASSISSWETGSDELIAMYGIMKDTEGIYGGRFSGAGFKGCCIALVDPDFTQSVYRTVGERYLAKFPALEGKFSAHVCHSSDGVSI